LPGLASRGEESGVQVCMPVDLHVRADEDVRAARLVRVGQFAKVCGWSLVREATAGVAAQGVWLMCAARTSSKPSRSASQAVGRGGLSRDGTSGSA
jgi:hypothetical protein